MFNNSIINGNVNLYEWGKAAAIRAIKTMSQVALGMITVGAAFYELDWVYIGSVAITSGIISILTSIAGIPEVSSNGETKNEG